MATDPKSEPRGAIHIEFHESGLRIESEGNLRPEELGTAAFYLTRTANQLLDAAAFRQAESTDDKGIAIVRALPDNLRKVD